MSFLLGFVLGGVIGGVATYFFVPAELKASAEDAVKKYLPANVVITTETSNTSANVAPTFVASNTTANNVPTV
jgi:gas vesicle protein